MSTSNPHFEAVPEAVSRTTENGKEVIIVKPRGLNVIWGKDNRYWNMPKDNDDKPAELLQVCWLEVTGSVDTDPQKNYEVSFNISLTPDAFGWGNTPVYIMLKRGKDGKFASKKHYLNNYDAKDKFQIKRKLMQNGRDTDGKLYYGLYEVWTGKWKGGLKIHDVTIKEVPTPILRTVTNPQTSLISKSF